MKLKAKIVVDGDKNISKIFQPETKKFQNNRAYYTIKTSGAKTEFDIHAQDSSALRAVLNSITKNLSVYEKVKNGQNN